MTSFKNQSFKLILYKNLVLYNTSKANMNLTFGRVFGISRQMEIIFLVILVLFINLFDLSFLELDSNLQKIWSTTVDPKKIHKNVHLIINKLLNGIVTVRTFTYHLNMLFLAIMIWPALSCSKPRMLMPWLLVGAIKNLCTGLMTFSIGLYICAAYGMCRPACIKFISSQVFDLVPSFYMWLVVFGFYRTLSMKKSMSTYSSHYHGLNQGKENEKKETQSVLDKKEENINEDGKMICAGNSAVVVDDIFKKKIWEDIEQNKSRSLDSLLSGIASETDTDDQEDFMIFEDNLTGLTVPEKAMKLLGITENQIRNTKTTEGFIGTEETAAYLIQADSKSYYVSESKTYCLKKNRLLAQTSLYSPPAKNIRNTRSEFKSNKDILKLKTVDFLQNKYETDVCNENSEKDVYVGFNEEEENLEKENVNVQSDENSLKKKCDSSDVACQVSTLSRRILKSAGRERKHNAQRTKRLVQTPSCTNLRDISTNVQIKRDRTYSQIYESRLEFINHMNKEIETATSECPDNCKYIQDGYSRYLDNYRKRQMEGKSLRQRPATVSIMPRKF